MKKSKKFDTRDKENTSINFDAAVIEELRNRAKESGYSVSTIVNEIVRRQIKGDEEFYSELAKMHYVRFQEAIYMRDQAKAEKER